MHDAEHPEGPGTGEAAPSKEPETEDLGSPTDRFVLLVRHGIAEARAEGSPDETRKLTKAGTARMREIGRGLAEVFPGAEAIYTSPLLRAAQTGACLAKGYRGRLEVQALGALAPGQEAGAFREVLAALPERRAIFVGHEPGLSGILQELCGLPASPMELKKGGCYGLRIRPDGTAKLEWMVPPRLLRRLAD